MSNDAITPRYPSECPDCHSLLAYHNTPEEAEDNIRTRAEHHGASFCEDRRARLRTRTKKGAA